MRPANVPQPEETGTVEGLAWALFLPDRPAEGGVVVLHGAGSRKESHYDFAGLCAASGLAAVVFDQRGHGESGGALDGRAVADVVAVSSVLPPGPVGLRGSSMGGYLAIVAADAVGARGVVAICPATAQGLSEGVERHEYDFAADERGLRALLAEYPEDVAAEDIPCPLLLLHAAEDEVVPVHLSERLHQRSVGSQLVIVPGGHHRSVQHDPDLQALSVRFLQEAFAVDEDEDDDYDDD
jgi:pimeloyl-ACP methyl ester carboxylesterase